MDIKDYKGSISLEDFAEGLTAMPNKKTLGTVWEHTVDCNHCSFRGHCKKQEFYKGHFTTNRK